MTKKNILVVEDDQALADVLSYNLTQAGYQVTLRQDGRSALAAARSHPPDLIILDLMLPLMDGTEVCRELRSDEKTSDTLILMLTAKSEETDQVVGFTLGADDYVTKPFSVKVLLERIKALLRRQTTTPSPSFATRSITLDRERHEVTIDGKPCHFTRTEFRLLETLMGRSGRVFRRDELIDAALGSDTIVTERTIDVHIRSLRRKLGRHARAIETVRGVGYRFRDDSH